MDTEQFEQEIKQKREEDIEPLVTEALKLMLEHDVRLGNSVYVYNRVLQIINGTITKLNFKNEKIAKARKAFFDVLIDGMQQGMFTIEDEIKEARKGIKSKDKEKKKKAVERLNQLERVRDKKPKDSTDERDIECEPVCQKLAKTILSKEWLKKDTNYIDKAIQCDDELLIIVAARGYVNLLFDKIGHALEQSFAYGNEKFWGEPKKKIRLSKIDKKLKE